MKKKRFRMTGKCLVALFLSLLVLPVPVKKAITVNLDQSVEAVSITDYVGKEVSLLCSLSSQQVTDPDPLLYMILAVEDADHRFIPIHGYPGLYVKPSAFIGRAIRKYEWCGMTNTFVFRGKLIPKGETNNYSMRLVSWDIVYPVYHHDLDLFSGTDFYKEHLFIFDYFRLRVN